MICSQIKQMCEQIIQTSFMNWINSLIEQIRLKKCFVYKSDLWTIKLRPILWTESIDLLKLFDSN